VRVHQRHADSSAYHVDASVQPDAITAARRSVLAGASHSG
jgi:hypothetical protein